MERPSTARWNDPSGSTIVGHYVAWPVCLAAHCSFFIPLSARGDGNYIVELDRPDGGTCTRSMTARGGARQFTLHKWIHYLPGQPYQDVCPSYR